jgi:hypothetical protein
MTHDNHEADVNTPPPGRIEIDALLDGEGVDKESLRRALGDSDARDYLIDALILRQITRDAGPMHYVAPGVPRSPFARSMQWLAASLVVAAGAGGGYVYGLRSQPATPTSSFEVVIDTAPAPVAPEPTQIIRFEPGVNWTSTSGSN